jgi:hypothetical protein
MPDQPTDKHVTSAFLGINPRRRQRWVSVRFGLELQAEFLIDGKLRYHLHRLTLLTKPIQSCLRGALDLARPRKST